MTKRKQIWKCEICGNIVEVLHEGADSLVCCNQPMKLIEEKTQNQENEGKEKHIPIINGKNIKIGSIDHPMTSEHYIEWVEATSVSGKSCKKFLKPEEKPEAKFSFEISHSRIYCNVHGLWKSN